MACANSGDQEPREILHRCSPPRSHPDGDRLREDIHRRKLHLPPREIWRSEAHLFLVDRGNLGKQTLSEFQQFVSPVNHYKFTEEYIVQRLTSNSLDTSARVVIGTIQRVYSMLKGEKEPAPDLDDLPIESADSLFKQPLPVEYNPDHA
ncbi:MAG: DEAD/DEAH box helicase family protein, partial [Rouxiella badensis]